MISHEEGRVGLPDPRLAGRKAVSLENKGERALLAEGRASAKALGWTSEKQHGGRSEQKESEGLRTDRSQDKGRGWPLKQEAPGGFGAARGDAILVLSVLLNRIPEPGINMKTQHVFGSQPWGWGVPECGASMPPPTAGHRRQERVRASSERGQACF